LVVHALPLNWVMREGPHDVLQTRLGKEVVGQVQRERNPACELTSNSLAPRTADDSGEMIITDSHHSRERPKAQVALAQEFG